MNNKVSKVIIYSAIGLIYVPLVAAGLACLYLALYIGYVTIFI